MPGRTWNSPSLPKLIHGFPGTSLSPCSRETSRQYWRRKSEIQPQTRGIIVTSQPGGQLGGQGVRGTTANNNSFILAYTSSNATVAILFRSREAGFLKELPANPKMEGRQFQVPALLFWGFKKAFLLPEYIWLLVLESKMLFFHLFILLKMLIKIGISQEVHFLWFSVLWSEKPKLGDKHARTERTRGWAAGGSSLEFSASRREGCYWQQSGTLLKQESTFLWIIYDCLPHLGCSLLHWFLQK